MIIILLYIHNSFYISVDLQKLQLNAVNLLLHKLLWTDMTRNSMPDGPRTIKIKMI